MPMLIPFAAAAGSIAAGITAGATTLVGGAMIAGGALTAIGAITKNQKLMKVGGLVSLAGGIGGLATSAWGAGAAATGGVVDQAAPMMGMDALRASELAGTSATNAAMSGAAGAAGSSTVASSLSDTVNGVGKWMSQNKVLVGVGAGILGGAMKHASEQDLLAERWRHEDEATALRRQQLSQSLLGLRMPVYSAPGATNAPQSVVPTTFAPTTYAPTIFAPNTQPSYKG